MAVYKHNISFWEQQSLLQLQYDVIVVGAGISGLSTAIQLLTHDDTLKVLILEKLPIGAGASSRNAGFACIGSISELESDLKNYGFDHTINTVRRRINGLRVLLDQLGEHEIGYEHKSGCEVFEDKLSFEANAARIPFWNEALEDYTYTKATFKKSNQNSMKFHFSSIENCAEGLLDTGKMYARLYNKAISLGAKILNSCNVANYEEVNEYIVLNLSNFEDSFRCKHLVLCSNAFSNSLVENLNLTPCRNQILVTSPIDKHPLNHGYHFDSGYIYFRAIGDRILIGGARNYFSEEDNQEHFGLNRDNIDYLKRFLSERILPGVDYRIDACWSGVLSGGIDRTPIVKYLSDRVLIGVRLGGMGVAIGSSIGQELAEMLIRKLND